MREQSGRRDIARTVSVAGLGAVPGLHHVHLSPRTVSDKCNASRTVAALTSFHPNGAPPKAGGMRLRSAMTSFVPRLSGPSSSTTTFDQRATWSPVTRQDCPSQQRPVRRRPLPQLFSQRDYLGERRSPLPGVGDAPLAHVEVNGAAGSVERRGHVGVGLLEGSVGDRGRPVALSSRFGVSAAAEALRKRAT